MYLKPQFEETRIEVLHRLVNANPLGTFVTLSSSEITIDHMPFVLDPNGTGYGSLKGHFPRANPVWQSFDGRLEAVVVFHGPTSYITPSWYPSKEAHGKVAPTWNFVVVHARGRPRPIDDPDWLLDHLSKLTDEHESKQARPWKLFDAPRSYRDHMISRIVGVEIPIDSLTGKWKVSQNRPVEDRLGVVAGLESLGDEASLAMARLVAERIGESS